MAISHFVYPLTSGYLDCFLLLTIIMLVWTTVHQVLVWIGFISLIICICIHINTHIYMRVELLGDTFQPFKEPSNFYTTGKYFILYQYCTGVQLLFFLTNTCDCVPSWLNRLVDKEYCIMNSNLHFPND